MGTVNEFGEPFWNSFGADGVDDIGFISSLIDYLDSRYNINMGKVYSTRYVKWRIYELYISM